MVNSFDEFFKNEMTGVTFDYPVEAAQHTWNYQQQKIDELESKLNQLNETMNEYYNGSFDTIGELAGEISTILSGEDHD